MCHTTLKQINAEANDKARLRLNERFLKPIELLTRYYKFYSNAASVVDSQNEPEAIKKNFFKEKEVEFKSALQKMNTTFSYDTETKILHIRMADKKYKHSVDHGGYMAEIGDDGSVIGIEIFNVVL